MALETVSPRITTNELLVQYLPCGREALHIQQLLFNSNVDGGTFKLRVNGELTTAITVTSTIATDIAAINAALDALPNLAAGEIEATGTALTDVTLTASAGNERWYTILIEDLLLTGNTTVDPDLQTVITTQGSTLYTLSGEMSDLDWEESIEDTDVTPINQFERIKLAVASVASFNLMLFRTVAADFAQTLFEGAEGWLYVFPRGKIAGRDYFIMPVIVDSYKEKFPDHEKVDVTVAGTRQGRFEVPPNSIYR